MSTRQGSNRPLEQATERNWTPRKGWRTSRVWMGGSKEITSLAAQVQRHQGAYVNMTVAPQDGGVSRLTVTFDDIQDGAQPVAASSGEPVADNDAWTLQGNDMEKSIWSHPSISALATTANSDYNWLRINLPPIIKNGTFQDVINAWSSYTWQDSATTLAIFKLFREGVESYSVSQFVLRRSRTIRSRAQGILSVSNVGKQFTIAQLQSAEQLPVTLRFATPSSGTWIKRTPTVNFDGNKVACDGEFWHADSWSTILYPVYT